MYYIWHVLVDYSVMKHIFELGRYFWNFTKINLTHRPLKCPILEIFVDYFKILENLLYIVIVFSMEIALL